MKVILCGYNWIGCKVLDLLLDQKHEVFVYTHTNPPHVNSLVEFCRKRSINYSLAKITTQNLPFNPDIICSIYYRYIIGESVINTVNGQIFNLHPSLLPEYKGCSSLTWAMINGEKEVGFTYHYIDKEIDTGNIILQERVVIEDWDTQVTLYHRVMFLAANSFLEAFDFVINERKGTPQLEGGAYYKRGCPYNGEIDGEWDLIKKEKFIRAMNYPPLPFATYKGKEIKRILDLEI